MKDYNCSIFIPAEMFNAATFSLKMRDIDFRYRTCKDGTIEICTEEKFAKSLDRLSKRCYNKIRK